jgi:hypothetical protein
MTKRTTFLATCLLAAACGGGKATTSTTTGGGDVATGGGGSGGAPADPTLAARQSFEDPGGMWTPRQMTEQSKILESLGIQIAPAALSDPTKAPLSAVVSLGGCTASFVSPEGLIITNHHCVQGALQLNSTPEDNLVENGFLAKTREEERWAGPAQRVYVAQKITDITEPMMKDLAAIDDPAKRHEAIETREKQLIAACEKDRPGIKCKTASYFKGLEWNLTEYLEIRDVRLVYVPHRAVGNYGGEIDNWAWPRHTGDFSFYRAYVGKDGQPADFSKDNVPYQPPAYLKTQAEGVKPHDLVFVTGYPGKTSRVAVPAELRRDIEWTLPRFIDKSNQRMAILEELQKAGGETAIKAGVTRQFVQNFLEKYSGILDTLQHSDLVQQREAEEKAFRAWAAEDPSRQRYVDALDQMLKILAEKWSVESKEAAWNDVVSGDGRNAGSKLLEKALFLTRWIDEQQKPDLERRLGYQDRDRKLLMGKEKSFAKSFDPAIDRAFFRMVIVRANQDPASAAWLPSLLGLKNGAKVTDKAIDAALDKLYATTKLADEKTRLALFDAKPAALKKSKDPFIRLAAKLYPTVRKNELREDAWYGELITVAPVYVEGLLAFKGGMVAPDANGTLRISYGTVRDFKPSADKEEYAPFTNVTEIPKKNTGEEPFDAPKKLLEQIEAKNWGPYASADAGGAVPVDFLSDLDITNGNSGSPVTNARGELVGVAFDGNTEGLASDVLFRGAVTRTITADIRYVLWVADAVDQADNVVQEMGITPSL